jgi:hypothetical protein
MLAASRRIRAWSAIVNPLRYLLEYALSLGASYLARGHYVRARRGSGGVFS